MTDISLTKDTAYYSISSWGQAAISLLLLPVLIARFSPSEYGYLILVNTVSSFLHLLGMLAVADQGLPRFFLRTDDALERRAYVASAFFITVAGNLIVVFLMFCSLPLLPVLFKEISSPLLFAGLVSLACLAQSFGILGNTLLRWTYQSPLFMKINLTKAVLTTVLTITGITLLDWRANGAILVAALSACLCGMWALHAVRDHIDLTMISREKSMDLLAYSWPLLGLNIFAYFTTSLDRILLAKWSTLYNVGVFSVASTVSSLFAIATSGFFMATGPYFLSTYKESWAPKKYAEYFSVLTVLGLSSIIILGLWGAPLVGMVKPRGEYAEIGRIIPWLTASSVLYFLGAYFAPGPYIQNKTYWILIAFIISTVVNAVACYLLIPRFGILGAGLAATIGSLSAAVFIQFTGNRLYAIPNRWATAFLLTILVAILVTLVQSPLFFYRFDHGALPSKLLTTALLIIGSSIPFYRELITSDLAKTVSRYIRRMTR